VLTGPLDVASGSPIFPRNTAGISVIYVCNGDTAILLRFAEFSCLASKDPAGKVTHGVRTATEGLAQVWSTLPNEIISYIKVIQCCRNIPGGGGGEEVALSASLHKVCV
jgi:hypothetical protein